MGTYDFLSELSEDDVDLDGDGKTAKNPIDGETDGDESDEDDYDADAADDTLSF